MILSVLASMLLLAAPPPSLSIEHTPVDSCAQGQPIALGAKIVSASGKRVFDPAAFVRAAGAKDYQRLPMLPGKMVDTFVAQVPAELVLGNLEYFLETFDEDGHGPFRQGSPEQPFRLAVLVAPPAVAVPPPPLPIAIEKPAEQSAASSPRSPVTLGGAVILGVGAAALVSCGIVGGLALSDYNDEKNASAAGNHDAWQAARDATRTKAVAADALLGVGAVAAAAGAALVIWGATHPVGTAAAPVAFGLSPTPGGAGAFVSGSF